MCDIATLCVSLVGLLLAVIYFVFRPSEQEPEPLGVDLTRPQNLKLVLHDYRKTNREVERRENITLVVGTIVVAASFLFLKDSLTTGPAGSRYLSAIASITFYSLWLFLLHWTTRQLDNLTYVRMRRIEEGIADFMGPGDSDYRFGIHTFLHGQGGTWWMQLRRSFWGWPLLTLSLCWLLASVL